MARRRSTTRTAVVLAAAAVLLTGCTEVEPVSTPAATAAYGELRLQLSWILNEEFSGEYLADANGYYDEAGFAEVTMLTGPSAGTAELLAGTADVAISDALSVGSAIAAQQAPLTIIGATFQKNPFAILSLAEKGIAAPADLVGKVIGVQQTNEDLFHALLVANGIDPAGVTVVTVHNDPSVLVNGDVDGYLANVTSEPLTVAALGIAVVTLPFADHGLPFVAEAFTTTDAYIAADRERLKAFLYAEIKGWTAAVNDPAAGSTLAVEVYGARLGLIPEASLAAAVAQAELLVVSDDTVANGLLTISDDLQAATIRSLAAAGIDVAAADLFDLSLLAEVYAEHPELVVYAR